MPAAIIIEDKAEWRKIIRQDISRYTRDSFELQNIIEADSLADAQSKLHTIKEPLILMMDLRLADGEQTNFDGLHWILEELEGFLRKKPATHVFVISGELNEGLIESLVRKGIPRHHIYEKFEWAEQRSKFAVAIQETITQLQNFSIMSVTEEMTPTTKIDALLIHTMRSTEQNNLVASENNPDFVSPPNLFPILVKARTKEWNYISIPELQMIAQVGTVFSCLGTPESIRALDQDPNVTNVEASRPASPPESVEALQFVKAYHPPTHPSEKGDHAIIALIDTGIDLKHEAFLEENGNTSRILAIWDQTDPTGPAPGEEYGLKSRIGTLYIHNDINDILNGSKPLPHALQVGDNDHGTHVASIAAGRSTGNFPGGVAPRAKLIIVKPLMEATDNNPVSLGYSSSHIAALKFIQEFSRQQNLPVVINVSQGMNAGAHDGTSALEAGFNEITNSGRDAGIVVVKSAGNEREQKIHAELNVPRDSTADLTWHSSSSSRSQDLIELWFYATDDIEFQLLSPSGMLSRKIKVHEQITGYFPSGNYFQMSYIKRHADNGDSRLSITISPGRSVYIEAGIWTLKIETRRILSGLIHAWIERDNARPIFFGDRHVNQKCTLSIPGTAEHVITVGAYNITQKRMADYSSEGPTRKAGEKPDVAAPGVNIICAAPNTINQAENCDGTSMAAPFVSGAIARLFSYRHKQILAGQEDTQFNSVQIKSTLTQTTQNYNGKHYSDMGFGIMDCSELINDLCP